MLTYIRRALKASGRYEGEILASQAVLACRQLELIYGKKVEISISAADNHDFLWLVVTIPVADTQNWSKNRLARYLG